MGQIIFSIFRFFTDVPYNIWPWLFFSIIPLLIFSANPYHGARWRLGRILLATAIGYVLVNLTLHTHRALDWKEFENCRAENPVVGENYHPKCEGIIYIADGASDVFYLVLGWIPAVAYTGFWEFWWRRKYRFIIGQLGKNYKGKWFSTTLIACSAPVWIYFFLLIIIIISKFFYNLSLGLF